MSKEDELKKAFFDAQRAMNEATSDTMPKAKETYAHASLALRDFLRTKRDFNIWENQWQQ